MVIEMVDEKMVNDIYDKIIEKFRELAEIEERLYHIQEELDGLKEGSTLRAQKQIELKDVEKLRRSVAREYNLLLIMRDRMNALLKLEDLK